MSIILKKVQRVNPADKKAPKKWYAVQHTLGMMDESEVAAQVAEETTLNPAEALMAIRQLRKVVQRTLLNGQSVKLGNWGIFSVTLSTTGSDTKEELTAGNVKQVRINFKPGDELKAAMQKATFVWGEDIMKNSTSSSDGSTDGGGGSDSGTGEGGNPL